MNTFFLSRIAILVALLFAMNACNHAPSPSTAEAPAVPSAEDIRIGRQAISINEVSLLARSGFHKDALTAVQQRHIPEHLTAEEDVQFKGFAKAELLAALKDPANILTPLQKDAYDEAKSKSANVKQQTANTQNLLANNQRQQANAQADQAWAASVAEQQETQRRAQLNREAIRAAEQSKAEQAAREHEQLRSVEDKWKTMEFQNDRHRTYATPPPVRRYRPYGN
jgi:hypothetical protein